MKRVLHYLNPLDNLGATHYSLFFPLAATIALSLLSEFYAYFIANDPLAVGAYIIFLNVGFVIYFAFRDGIRGGTISAAISIAYYFYIIYTRHFTGERLGSGINTTIMLGATYFLLALIVGWLKQRIDKLIEAHADEKRRLEAIIQQLPVGVIITDSEGRLEQRNTKLDSIIGVKLPIGFRIGKDTLKKEKINGKPVNPSESPLHNALLTGKPVIGKEFIFERADGKQVTILVSSTPILNKKKRVIAAASIVSDITQQKQLERQKDDFLAIASHELKTPITSIKAYAQMLMMKFDKKGDTRAVEQLQKLETQANKLTNLISDLLDVTKIQSGKLEFHRERFDFNELVKEIVEEMQLTVNSHKIVTKLDKTASIIADRERVGQVIINLISNGVKYSPESKKINIETHLSKDSISLTVTDYGVGIPKDKQKKVFEQFFRVGGKKGNTFPGLGLGLYICSQIIKREGGEIHVQSTPGKGAAFSFSLPLIRQ